MADLNQILQLAQVDVGNNTLFEQREKFPIATDHLTLIIASGGSGTAVIKKVIDSAIQKLNDDYKRYVKFIVIDSATNEIDNDSQKYNSLIEYIKISVDGIQERLAPERRPPFYRKFIPENFPLGTINSVGAGQMRLAGKIKLYDQNNTNGECNDDIIRRKIQKFYQNEWSTQSNLPIDIMIVAGLCGGNGSGTYEDIAVIARDAVRRVVGDGINPAVYGYLLLPDNVNIENNLASNAYAALKELENNMSVHYGSGKTYYSQNTSVAIQSNAVFDYPVLITGVAEESQSLLAESILNLIVKIEQNNNVNMNQSVHLQKSFYSNRDAARNSYINNAAHLQDGVLAEGFYPEDSRRYAGIGYAKAAIPIERVVANIVSYAANSAYKITENPNDDNIGFCTSEARDVLTETIMKTQIKHLFSIGNSGDLYINDLWNLLNRNLDAFLEEKVKNDGEVSRKDIEAGRIDAYGAGFQIEDRALEGYAHFKEYINTLKDRFHANSVKVMKQYGPYAMYLLYEGIGPKDKKGKPTEVVSIKKMIEHVDAQFEVIKNTAASEMPKLRHANFFVKFGEATGITETNINEWKKAYRDRKQSEVKRNIIENITKSRESWELLKEDIKQYIEKCLAFNERLDKCRKFYHTNGSVLDSQDLQEFLEKSKENNLVNLCDNQDVYQWVQSVVRERKNHVRTEDVRGQLIDSFIEAEEIGDTNLWLSDKEGVTRKEFDRVMSSCCKLGSYAEEGRSTLLSATAYFEHKLEQVQPAMVQNTADEIARNIVNQLIVKSKPSLKLRDDAFYKTNIHVLLPMSICMGGNSQYADNIRSALESAFTNAMGVQTAFNGHGAQIIPSESVVDIVCYQTNIAVALSDLKDLQMWEKKYYSLGAATSYRHLHQGEGVVGGSYVEWTKRQTYQNTNAARWPITDRENKIFGKGLSLENYPPINMHGLKENEKEKAYREEVFNPIVEYALKEKIIERVDLTDSNKHLYQMWVLPEEWKSLNIDDYYEQDENGCLARGKELFSYLKSKNSSEENQSEGAKARIIALKESHWFDDGGFDFTEAKRRLDDSEIEKYSKQYLKRILRKNTELYIELRKTLNRYYDIAVQLEERDARVVLERNVEIFIEGYINGVLEENENGWYAYYSEKERVSILNNSYSTKMAYSHVEKALEDKGLRFVIALNKSLKKVVFEKLNLYARIKVEQYEGEERKDELEKMQMQKCQELRNMRGIILTTFGANIHSLEAKAKSALRTGRESREEEKELEYYVSLIKEIVRAFPAEIAESNSTVVHQKKNLMETTETMYECPKCGNNVGGRFNFCPMCGTEIVQEWECTNCGTVNQAKNKFCGGCGKSRD